MTIAMIKEYDFNDKQCELYDLMSEISEDLYCAGWETGLEYIIWDELQDGNLAGINPEQIEQCRTLSTELDGWIIWVDDYRCKTLPVDEWGPRFVNMNDWMEIYRERK